MASYNPKWTLGTILYLKVDAENAGMLTSYLIRPGNIIIYGITWAENGETFHYEMELSDEKSFETK